MIEEVLESCKEGLEKALSNLAREFSKVRTGRANPAILDSLRVDYYGVPTPIKQMATIAVPENRLIVISPFDGTQCNVIAKAIQSSDLNLNPMNDGKVIRIAIPALTEERRKDLAKQVKKIGEEHKIVVRKERRDANDMLKDLEKEKEISEDDQRRGEERVQKLHDEYIKKIDELVAKKEAEIMEI